MPGIGEGRNFVSVSIAFDPARRLELPGRVSVSRHPIKRVTVYTPRHSGVYTL